jgi:hypothetical protein
VSSDKQGGPLTITHTDTDLEHRVATLEHEVAELRLSLKRFLAMSGGLASSTAEELRKAPLTED